jgi:hypothetical protein
MQGRQRGLDNHFGVAYLECGLGECHTVKICYGQFLAALPCARGNNLSANAALRFRVFCEFPQVPTQAVCSCVMASEEKGAANDDQISATLCGPC